jgi:sigma-E factor negative regulatory protein RseB
MKILSFARSGACAGLIAAALGTGAWPVWAQVQGGESAATQAAPDASMSIQQWLERLHEASRRRAYVGTFVVSAGPEIAASKIWHVCDGSQQLERIDTLTGAPRTTMRRNDEVVTLIPEARVAVKEKREALRLFPDLLSAPGQQIDSLYAARKVGRERVAGHEAVVVDFLPKDDLRYGYRIWSEKNSGLVMKLQTRDGAGQVMEQVAFTDLTFDPSLKMEALARQMVVPKGYELVKPTLRKTTPEAEGWRLSQPVRGFQSMSCHIRSDAPVRESSVVQWVFSDGLASVSLFLETFDPQRHSNPVAMSAGATHSLTRRVGEYWVTALGEVPPDTLRQFVEALERTR